MLKPIRIEPSAGQEKRSTKLRAFGRRPRKRRCWRRGCSAFTTLRSYRRILEIFLAGVVEVFCNYPLPVVARAVSPVFGIPRRHKFPPRLSEIVDWLEEDMAPAAPRAGASRVPSLALPAPTEIDRSKRLSYEELKAKYGPNWGITDPGRPKRTDWRDAAAAAVKAQVSAEEWAKIPNATGPRK